MYSYRVVSTNGVLVPDLFIDLVNGKDFPGIFDEQQQDIVFNGGKLNQLSVHRDLFVFIIDLKAAASVDLGIILLIQISKLGIAAELGLYPGDQLQRIKWLGNIVVSSNIKSQDLIRILGFSREDDDGNAAGLADL